MAARFIALYCHIDLVHSLTALDFTFVPADQGPDLFGPFIRVTCGYNGLCALGFDIGFHPKICKNAMIVPDTIVSCNFTHSRSDNRQNFRPLCVAGNVRQGIAA